MQDWIKNPPKEYIYTHTYITERERERERERESNHIFYGRRVQNKNSLPYMKTQERIINPPNKKKKKTMRERESYHILVWEIWIEWEITFYLLFIAKKMG